MLQGAEETINDVEKTTYDPLGTWSDDENIDVREEEDDVDVSDEKVKELLNQEFPGKISEHGVTNQWQWIGASKVGDKVSLRDPSAPNMFELMGMDISSLYKGLDEGWIQ